MTVATFTQPNFTTQLGNSYKGNIDGGLSVFARIAGAFAPHEQSTPNMTVRVDTGYVFTSGSVLTEVAAQNSATIVAPTTNPRIDRIVVDAVTGVVAVVTGVQGASPAAPAIPVGKLPVAQVQLQTTSTVITNSMLTDERLADWSMGRAGMANGLASLDGSGKLPAGQLTALRGVLARSTVSQSINGGSVFNTVLFNTEDYDTESMHSTVSNTSRIVIPTGVTRAQFFGGVEAQIVDGDSTKLYLSRNGSPGNVSPLVATSGKGTSFGFDVFQFSSPIMNVVAGDYFEMFFSYSGAAATSMTAEGTYLGMNIIE